VYRRLQYGDTLILCGLLPLKYCKGTNENTNCWIDLLPYGPFTFIQGLTIWSPLASPPPPPGRVVMRLITKVRKETSVTDGLTRIENSRNSRKMMMMMMF